MLDRLRNTVKASHHNLMMTVTRSNSNHSISTDDCSLTDNDLGVEDDAQGLDKLDARADKSVTSSSVAGKSIQSFHKVGRFFMSVGQCVRVPPRHSTSQLLGCVTNHLLLALQAIEAGSHRDEPSLVSLRWVLVTMSILFIAFAGINHVLVGRIVQSATDNGQVLSLEGQRVALQQVGEVNWLRCDFGAVYEWHVGEP